MTRKKLEIDKDIIENCDIVLNLLKSFKAENETPEERMIYQCRWLKEQIAENKLPLPTNNFVHTLKYVSSEGLLDHLASSKETEWHDIGKYLYRLVVLIDNKLITKPAYYPYINRLIDILVHLLNNPGRPLNEYEHGLVDELQKLKKSLQDKSIEPPLASYFPDYTNFRKVYRLTKSSIDDLTNGKYLIKTIANLIFEGVRPDSWLTPEDADRETKALLDRKYEVEGV